MAVIASDMQFRLSGGASESNPNNALGGVKSSVSISSATAENLFDDVQASEASAGDVEYRCFYVHNNNAVDTLQNVVMFISQITPSTDSVIAIGADPIGVGDGSSTGVATTIANESTAPAGVSFSSPITVGTGIALGTLTALQSRAVWVRRTISAAASTFAADSFKLEIRGEVV